MYQPKIEPTAARRLIKDDFFLKLLEMMVIKKFCLNPAATSIYDWNLEPLADSSKEAICRKYKNETGITKEISTIKKDFESNETRHLGRTADLCTLVKYICTAWKDKNEQEVITLFVNKYLHLHSLFDKAFIDRHGKSYIAYHLNGKTAFLKDYCNLFARNELLNQIKMQIADYYINNRTCRIGTASYLARCIVADINDTGNYNIFGKIVRNLTGGIQNILKDTEIEQRFHVYEQYIPYQLERNTEPRWQFYARYAYNNRPETKLWFDFWLGGYSFQELAQINHCTVDEVKAAIQLINEELDQKYENDFKINYLNKN